jgi:outer membrane protein
MIMKLQSLALAAAALSATIAGSAQAQDFKPKTAGTWIVDTRITDVAPSGSDAITTLAGAATGLKADVTSSIFPTLGVSYFLTDNLAVEVIAGTTDHMVKAKGPTTNLDVLHTWVLPPTATLQYHFAPDAKVSPYLGTGVNYMLFYNGKDKNGFKLRLDNGFGYAVQGGVDVAVTGPWSVNLDLKKIYFTTDAVDRVNGVKSKVHLDPLVASVGLAYRF